MGHRSPKRTVIDSKKKNSVNSALRETMGTLRVIELCYVDICRSCCPYLICLTTSPSTCLLYSDYCPLSYTVIAQGLLHSLSDPV